jgi:sec-independent protein translocase protein TatB
VSGVSFQEFFLLLVIGLVVLGPKRLPQVANQIGNWIGQARRMTRMMKRQLEDEINFDLDSLNVQKQLGLDKDYSPAKKPSVSNPSYVQDKPGSDTDTTPQASASADEAGAADEAERDELPDDYSPAHGPDDLGTGVGDDRDYVDDDELEPVSIADVDSAADSTARQDDKKETA